MTPEHKTAVDSLATIRDPDFTRFITAQAILIGALAVVAAINRAADITSGAKSRFSND